MFDNGDLVHIDFSSIEQTTTLDQKFVMDNAYFFDTEAGYSEFKIVLFLNTKFLGDYLLEDVFQSVIYVPKEQCFYEILYRTNIIKYTLLGEINNEKI
tara:strand:- start:1032 stop:1325 length:294 start_codon:yes stop_codon:yes gene_type:complete